MAADLRRLAGGNENRDRHEAAVAGRKFGSLPHLAEEDAIGEMAKPRRNVIDRRRSDPPPFLLCFDACDGERGHGDAGGDVLHPDFPLHTVSVG
ncbi:hypothetical protein D3C80_929000 [compost metagenome]